MLTVPQKSVASAIRTRGKWQEHIAPLCCAFETLSVFVSWVTAAFGHFREVFV